MLIADSLIAASSCMKPMLAHGSRVARVGAYPTLEARPCSLPRRPLPHPVPHPALDRMRRTDLVFESYRVPSGRENVSRRTARMR